MDEKIRAAGISRKKLFATSVVMKDLTKVYHGQIAVKNLTMRIEDGESFGFLGLNGSGKSSLLKMLAGQSLPSRGGAYIHGRSLITKKNECLKEIGFCPGGGFYDDFKVSEYIKVFLLIHGYSCADIKKMVPLFASSFVYTQHIKDKLKDCTDYTKKKINLNVALIGNPKIILIDEPTKGMDSFKSSVIWKIINGIRKAGKTIIVTTFDVEEVIKLCDRFGILSNGEMVSVGTNDEILSKFGEGWSLQLRINEKFWIAATRKTEKYFDKLDEFITLNFFGAILRLVFACVF